MKRNKQFLILSMATMSAATFGAETNISNAVIMGHVCNQSGYTNECKPSIGKADNVVVNSGSTSIEKADNVVINSGANVTINGDSYDDTALRERLYEAEKQISMEGQIRHESDKRLLEGIDIAREESAAHDKIQDGKITALENGKADKKSVSDLNKRVDATNAHLGAVSKTVSTVNKRVDELSEFTNDVSDRVVATNERITEAKKEQAAVNADLKKETQRVENESKNRDEFLGSKINQVNSESVARDQAQDIRFKEFEATQAVIDAGQFVQLDQLRLDGKVMSDRVTQNGFRIDALELRMDGAEQKINWLEQEAKNIRGLVAGVAAFAAIPETDFNSVGFGFASDMYGNASFAFGGTNILYYSEDWYVLLKYGITGQPEKFKETGMVMTGLAVAY